MNKIEDTRIAIKKLREDTDIDITKQDDAILVTFFPETKDETTEKLITLLRGNFLYA